jgi:2-aminoadipate transaminase
LARVKFLYWGTSFQNPTGLSATLANKAAVLATLRRFERAAGHPIHLLEDAAYRELRFAGPEVPSALALPGAEGRVIYAGTYSKPFATGIRIGYGLLPDPLLGVAARIKANHDFGSPNLLQQILALALRSGAYQSHLSTLRKRYADKARTTTIALRKHFPESVQWDEPRGGLYVWARGPAWLKTGPRSRFFQAAMQRDVLYVPGEFCYGDDPTRRKPEHEMRLSFGSASHAHLRSGIERLGTVLRQFIKP